MGYPIAHLRISIEKMRKKLYELSKNKALTDPEVVSMSQSLDLLLNEYENQKKQFVIN